MDRQAENSGVNGEEAILLALKNGEVVISGERVEGKKGALIRPGRGAVVTVNGRVVKGFAEVFPGDKVGLQAEEELVPDSLEVKVSADGLTAEARYMPGKRMTHVFEDFPYTAEFVVDGTPVQEEHRLLQASDVSDSIRAQGIVFGFDECSPARLLTEGGSWQPVAQGTPAVKGTAGRVEVCFEGAARSVRYDQEEAQVDYRQRFEIEQVDSGDVIALVHPPLPGKPGRRVTGEEIKPDEVHKAEVYCDSGTALSADGIKVTATRKGQPSYKKGKAHSFRVDDIYFQKGDVDIKSGNIYFRGHFKVQGNITEGMKVAADGNIEITESASGAEILAGENVLFRGSCIKCTVQAGWVDLLLKDIYLHLEEMNESVGNALEASEEVARTLVEKGRHSEQMEAAVVRALLQSKFSDLPQHSAELLKQLKSAGKSLPDHVASVIKDTAPYFVDYQYSQSLCRPLLAQIKERLQSVSSGRKGRMEKADITAPYIQNSSLTCTGDIIIVGPGVYNSNLKCEGDVKIDRLFRGGRIEAAGDVYIGEAGSPRITADQGSIQVTYKSSVYLGTAYENIRIRFGSCEYRCEDVMKNVRLVLDQQEYEVNVLSWKK